MKYKLGGKFLFVISVSFFCIGAFLLYLISPVFAEDANCDTETREKIEEILGQPLQGESLEIFSGNCGTKTLEEIIGLIVNKISFHLTIDPLDFKAEEKIKTIVMNSVGNDKEVYLRATKDNSNKPVFEIGVLSGTEYVVRNKVGNNGSSSIGGSGNKNEAGKETSMVLGGELNELSGSGGHSVIAGGKKNLIKWPNSIVFGSNNVSLFGYGIASDNVSGSIALGVSGSQIYSWNSVALAGENILLGTGSTGSVGIGSKIVIKQPSVFAFNAKNDTLVVGDSSLSRSFLVYADKGMVIGGNRFNSNTKVQLTVNGAIKLGEPNKARGFCSANTVGSLYKVETSDKMWTCVCACVKGGKSVAISNQPYCDNVCKRGGNIQDDGGVCGTRGLSGSVESGAIYEYFEKTWRPGTEYCQGLTLPMVQDDLGVWEVSQEVDFPEAGTGVVWGCPGLGNRTDNMVECYAKRKSAPPECGVNARTYAMNTTTWTGASESDFCLTGNLTEITVNGGTYTANTAFTIEYLLSHGAVPFPGTGENNNKATWVCSSNIGLIDNEGHLRQDDIRCNAERKTCNHCAKNGFDYCFDIDFSDTCEELDY